MRFDSAALHRLIHSAGSKLATQLFCDFADEPKVKSKEEVMIPKLNTLITLFKYFMAYSPIVTILITIPFLIKELKSFYQTRQKKKQ